MQDTFHRGKVHANEVTRKEAPLRGEEEPSSFEKHGAIEVLRWFHSSQQA